MKNLLYSILNFVFRKFGYTLVKYVPLNKFDYLLEQKRYKQLDVIIDSSVFTIADSVSFHGSFQEIFVEKIYKFYSKSNNPKIIDAGSNIGLSILYFKKLFPNSEIISFEPDPYIFSILTENVVNNNLTKVKLINKAVSHENKIVKFYHEGSDGGRMGLNEDSKLSFDVECINLDDYLTNDIDFLKIDIEGEENNLIPNLHNLGCVKNIFIEYHSFVNQNQSLSKILLKLENCGFRYYIHKQFCSDKPFTKLSSQLGMDLQLNIFAIKE